MLLLSDYVDTSLSNTPYASPLEHLQDHLALIHIYLECYQSLSNKIETPSETEPSSDIAVLLSMWEYIFSREKASPYQEFFPLFQLKNALNLSFFEYLCLLLSVSIELDDSLKATYQKLCQSDTPTFFLALCLYGITEQVDESLFKDAYLTASALQYALVFNEDTYYKESFMSYPLRLRKNVLLFLTGQLQTLPPYYYIETPEATTNFAPLHLDTLHQLITFFESAQGALKQSKKVIVLEGPKGVGKQTLLKRLGLHFNMSILFIDIEKLETLEPARLQNLLYEIYLHALLNNGFICLSGCNDTSNKKIYDMILSKLSPYVRYVFLTFHKAPTTNLSDTSFQVLSLPLTTTSLKDKYALWHYMKDTYQLTIDPKAYASKYHLTIGALEQILNNCQLIAAYEGSNSISEAHLIKGILATNKLTANTYLVKHRYTFDDLILDDKVLATLKQISNYVKNRHTVFEEWGFSEKLAYGKGTTMLFYGSPGTGKTMCASVLANEWGLDLVKVDLSQVVDKYIGETEKKLDAIFENAKQNNCVLFFDEADSLFSKRTEIQSSNDKYANVEVSHLLQKLELYDGIVILATNLAQNFDDAFKRRIQFMVHFSLPSSQIRKTIWEKVFPASAPLADDIDFDELGERFEISPSIIKSSALYAAFLAQADTGEITMSHIMEALRYEYEKNGRIMPC